MKDVLNWPIGQSLLKTRQIQQASLIERDMKQELVSVLENGVVALRGRSCWYKGVVERLFLYLEDPKDSPNSRGKKSISKERDEKSLPVG